MEKTLTEPPINHIPEVRERKLLSGEKVSIPAGSAKLEKIRESDYTTYESKRKFICESFKINKMRYIDKVVQMFLDNFSALVLHASH